MQRLDVVELEGAVWHQLPGTEYAYELISVLTGMVTGCRGEPNDAREGVVHHVLHPLGVRYEQGAQRSFDALRVAVHGVRDRGRGHVSDEPRDGRSELPGQAVHPHECRQIVQPKKPLVVPHSWVYQPRHAVTCTVVR